MLSFRWAAVAALAVLVAPGCDSGSNQTGTDPREDDLFEPGCEASTAENVTPTGTYLRTNDDDPDAPTVLTLSRLGVAPGDRLALERLGEYQYRVDSDPSDVRREMAAVFSTSTDLRGADQEARVVDAIDAGDDYTSRPSRGDNGSTDIPEDFEVGDSTVVTVPAGARYLFVAPPDDRFRDNADEDDDYRICITDVS